MNVDHASQSQQQQQQQQQQQEWTRPRVPFPPQSFDEPQLHRARRNPTVCLEDGSTRTLYLTRDDHCQQQQQQQQRVAYHLLPKKEKLHNGRKGYILYAVVFEQVPSSSPHQRPPHGCCYRETNRVVVIKKLKKQWLRANHIHDNNNDENANAENPYNEIAASELVGDNHHVLKMEAALYDDKNLYLVMPFVGQDLLRCLWKSTVHNNDNDDDDESSCAANVPVLLQTLVHNLLHLQRFGLIHRDVSPENIVVHQEYHERSCPLIDLAMALRAVSLENNPQFISAGQRVCGKLPYMAPEIYTQSVLDHTRVDVWSLGCVLFVVWTNQRLYDCIGDRSYLFFIQEGGLVHQDRLESTLELLLQLCLQEEQERRMIPPEFVQLTSRIQAVLHHLDHSQRDLLSRMLQPIPHQRITAEEILQHEWVANRMQ